MAHVAQDRALHERIEKYLTYLTREWEGIASLPAEWDAWDQHSRLVFEVDWAVPEDRLLEIQGWAGQGFLTPSQHARYERLLALVATNRPVLERLLRD